MYRQPWPLHLNDLGGSLQCGRPQGLVVERASGRTGVAATGDSDKVGPLVEEPHEFIPLTTGEHIRAWT